MISCWWRDCGWLRHCSLWSLMCVCVGGGVFIYLFVCVFVHMCELRWSYIAHVDNLGSLLHPLHLRWRRQGMENRGRERESWKCDLTSEELYWWFMLLHMKRFTPSAAVRATCSIWFHNIFHVLGNSFFFFFFSTEPSRPLLSCQFAGGVVLTQRQVHVLVTLLFPEWLRISLRLESARTVRHKNVFQSHVFILQWASQCDGVAVIHSAYLCCLEVSTARC